MVTAVLSGNIKSGAYKDLEVPFRSIALRMQFGAKELSDTRVCFTSLTLAKLWLFAVALQFKEDYDTYLLEGGCFFRHGDACIDIED